MEIPVVEVAQEARVRSGAWTRVRGGVEREVVRRGVRGVRVEAGKGGRAVKAGWRRLWRSGRWGRRTRNRASRRKGGEGLLGVKDDETVGGGLRRMDTAAARARVPLRGVAVEVLTA